MYAYAKGKKLTFVKEGKELLICYGKGNECPKGEEPFWTIYFVMVLCGSLAYTFNLYFNTKRSTAKNYNQAVEDFCKGIELKTGKMADAESKQAKEALG